MKRFSRKRTGFTLIELMVVMGIIALLTAMVMLVAPNVLDKDRARDAATQLQGALLDARNRATRDIVPRGVRLIIDPALQSQNFVYPMVSSSTGLPEYTFITASSYQYIEVPPWLIFTNQSGASVANGAPPPFLQLQYTYAQQPFTITQGTNTYTYPAGSIQNRTCTIGGLTSGQLQQLTAIINGPPQPPSYAPPTLGLPTISFWTTINPGTLIQTGATSTNPPTFSCTIQLSIYPDAMMGAANLWRTPTGVTNPSLTGTTYFGIYQAPRPLLGESIMQMPVNTTIDLSDGVSLPSFQQIGGINPNTNNGQPSLLGYDILFSPNGQMMTPYGFSQVYLWVRDATKGPQNLVGAMLSNNTDQGAFFSISPFTFNNTGASTTPQYQAAFPKSGEQLLVTVKGKSGATGVSPVNWPAGANSTPYDYARTQANSP